MRRPLLVTSASVVAGLAAGALAFVACDESGTIVPPADASIDTTQAETSVPAEDATPDDAADAGAAAEASLADVCGPGPWVTLGIVVVALDLSNPDGSVLPGASFTSPLCPGLSKVSDTSGVITGLISKDTPFYGRLQAKNYVPELAPEEIYDADSTGNRIEMLPGILAGLVPGYQPDASTIVVAAQKIQADAGACSSLDGVTLSVVGHPEAHVTYFDTGSIPMPLPDASATSTRGFAAITGLTFTGASTFVTLAGEKPGCSVVFARGPVTGRVPLENGSVSLMPAYVTP